MEPANVFNSLTASPEQREREIEYKKYVDNHIQNVQTAWDNMNRNTDCLDFIYSVCGNVIDTIDQLILVHDKSKFSDEEWEPYRKNFYPINDDEKKANKEDFDAAWKHHYMNNLHHWNYWSTMNRVDMMPIEFVIEMCCDWIAMSAVFGGDAYHWYKDQKDIVLGEKQRYLVETILKKFYHIAE
jgi:hypothetical protein